MTIESGRTEELSSTELIESMASTSADLWNEVLQRLNEVQEGHTRLVEAVDHLGDVVSSALAIESEQDEDRSVGLDLPAAETPTEVGRDAGGGSFEAPAAAQPKTAEETPKPETASRSPVGTTSREKRWMAQTTAAPSLPQGADAEKERAWLAEPVAAKAPSQVSEPEGAERNFEEPGAEAPGDERAETSVEPPRGVTTEAAEPEPTVNEATAPAALEQGMVAETSAAAEPAIPEPEPAPAPQADVEPAIPEPELVPEPEVGSVPWLAAEPRIPEPAAADVTPAVEVTEVTAPAPPTSGAAGARIDTAPTASAAPPRTAPMPGARVLDPRRIVDLTPEVLDAVLAAEFGDARADAPGHDGPSVQALLDAEFTPTGRVATTPEVPPLVPPTTAESDRPPLPSQVLPSPPSAPLPPPPTNLLPPPPDPEIVGAVRPTPLAEIAGRDPGSIGDAASAQSASNAQTPTPPPAVEAPPAEEGRLEPSPAPIPGANAPGPGGELPPLSLGSPASDREPTLPTEPPPIPEATSAPPEKESGRLVDPEAYVTASSMVTEILDIPSVESPQTSQEEAEDATVAPEPPATNVVSQDFTIISKKHKRFRLR